MDGYAVMVCPDSQLKSLGLDALGDILAIKNFVLQKDSTDYDKVSLVQSIKGNKNSQQTSRKRYDGYKVKFGMQQYCTKKRKYVSVRKCGGVRELHFNKSATINEIKEAAVTTFFPENKCALGYKHEFCLKLANFAGEEIKDTEEVDTWTLEQYVKLHKLSHVRLYLLVRKRTWKDLFLNESVEDEFEESTTRFRGQYSIIKADSVIQQFIIHLISLDP